MKQEKHGFKTEISILKEKAFMFCVYPDDDQLIRLKHAALLMCTY
jgi:hypothetical protein